MPHLPLVSLLCTNSTRHTLTMQHHTHHTPHPHPHHTEQPLSATGLWISSAAAAVAAASALAGASATAGGAMLLAPSLRPSFLRGGTPDAAADDDKPPQAISVHFTQTFQKLSDMQDAERTAVAAEIERFILKATSAITDGSFNQQDGIEGRTLEEINAIDNNSMTTEMVFQFLSLLLTKINTFMLPPQSGANAEAEKKRKTTMFTTFDHNLAE